MHNWRRRIDRSTFIYRNGTCSDGGGPRQGGAAARTWRRATGPTIGLGAAVGRAGGGKVKEQRVGWSGRHRGPCQCQCLGVCVSQIPGASRYVGRRVARFRSRRYQPSTVLTLTGCLVTTCKRVKVNSARRRATERYLPSDKSKRSPHSPSPSRLVPDSPPPEGYKHICLNIIVKI